MGDDGAPVGVAELAAEWHQRTAGEGESDGPGGGVELELKEQQLETGTPPCTSPAELGRELRAGRVRLVDAARSAGARLAALGTSPIDVETSFTDSARYRRMEREFAVTAREQLTCGCHVHIEIADRDEGVAALDRMGPWLPVLLALSANSPFWHGSDSGYASYRSQVWGRWPSAGPTAPFGSAEEYDRVIAGLIATGVVLDEHMVYFDARLSGTYSTLEVRIADVCLRADDAQLIAVLARALVETAIRQAEAGIAPEEHRVDLLRTAAWRAGRSGLSGVLVSPTTFRPAAAWDVVEELVRHVRPVLDEQGDSDIVNHLLRTLRERGTGADAQRRWARQGDLASLVDRAVAATAG